MDSGTLSDVAKKDADPDAGDERGDEEGGVDALRLLPAVVWAFCCQCTLFDLADRVLGWDVVGSYVDAHAFLFQTAGALLLAAGLASALLPGASLPRRLRPSLAAAPRDGGPLEEAGGVAAALAGLLHALSALPAHWSASTGLLLLALAAILLASPAATAGFRRRPGLPPAGCSWALAAAALAALRRSLGALRPLLGSPVFKVAIGGLAFCCAAALALDARVSRRRRGGGRRPAAAAAATGAEGPAPQKEDESLNAAPQTEAENLVADSIPSDPAEVDGELFEAMRFAVGKHHPATVRQLLKYAPDPLALLQKRDEDGNTLLHTAGSDEPGAAVCDTMSCLLRGRADVAAKNILGETPLLMAMRASMDFSSTPRSRAADACDDSSDSSLQAVRCLLEQRADANVVDELNGETPLVEAACRGCAAMCRLLLEFGADPRLETTNGVTALNFAAGAAIKRLLQAAAGMEVDPAEEDVPAHESSEPTSPPSAGFNGHAAAQEANGQDCEEPGEEADEGSEASSAAADEAEEDSSPGKSATPDFEPFNRPNPNFAKSAGGFSKVGASLPRFVSAGTFCGGKPMGGPNRPIFAVGPKPMGMPNQRAAFPGTGLNHGPRPNSMPGFSFATPGGRFMPGGMMSGFSGPNSMPGPGFRPPPVFGGARPSGPAGRGGYGGYDGFPSWAKPKFSVPPKESLFRPPPPSAAAERHYRVLGLRPGAKADDVRRAYRKLALQYHPDKNSDSAGATEKFREIKEAYEAICKLLA